MKSIYSFTPSGFLEDIRQTLGMSRRQFANDVLHIPPSTFQSQMQAGSNISIEAYLTAAAYLYVQNKNLFQKVIGRLIKAKRRALELSQKQFADRLNLSESSIFKYEQGLVDLPLSALLNILVLEEDGAE